MKENRKQDVEEECGKNGNYKDDNNEMSGENDVQQQEAAAEEQKGIEDLTKQLEEYKQKSEEYYNSYLRAKAELDNYRKRVIKEREDMYQNAASEVLTQFLGVLDSMERASQFLDANNECDSSNSVEEGISMVSKQLKEILTKFGVEEIPAEDQQFDPNLHYAIMQVESPDKEEGQIVEVLQKGYRTKSRILRPSMVQVAK